MTFDHCGHGDGPLRSQFPDNQLPSMAIANLPFGRYSCATVLAHVGARACCGVGPRPEEYTVCTNPMASENPCEPTTHFWLALSNSVPFGVP